jgi:hypothetical protein
MRCLNYACRLPRGYGKRYPYIVINLRKEYAASQSIGLCPPKSKSLCWWPDDLVEGLGADQFLPPFAILISKHQT